MSISSEPTTLTVALIGNPNTGKSTLFNALVGVHQHVGNYPGVTVEKRTGHMQHGGQGYEFIDLPGLYSLAPQSRDEMVTVEVLLGHQHLTRPLDAVICIVDASNLQRNLYLVSQVLEFGIPIVLAVNMLDVATRHDISIDLERLAKQIGVPVVGIQANRRLGVDRLKTVLETAIRQDPRSTKTLFPEVVEQEVSRLQSVLSPAGNGDKQRLPRYLVQRLLLNIDDQFQHELFPNRDAEIRRELRVSRERLRQQGCKVPGVEPEARYAWACQVLQGAVAQPHGHRVTASDRIDHIMTHRIWGTLLFVVVMVVMFQAVFSWASPLMDLIDQTIGLLGGWVEGQMAAGALRSLIVDGVISGVGGVLVFLPQILILFLFIGVLEDCGYMARAAFLMDRLMARIGLSGKSFIPMLSSFACAVPGIMATRVIENERDRLTTILVTPLMTCSARLPIYALLIAAFVPARNFFGGLLNLQGITLMALYVLGIATAIVVAMLLKRTVLRGRTVPFVLELPSYKWPSPRTVLYRVMQRGWAFLRCAGTLILAVSIIVWAALYYPHDAEKVEAPFRQKQQTLQQQLALFPPASEERVQVENKLRVLEHQIAGAYQRQSLLGQLGHTIEPIVQPLGWDWRIGCAVIASLPARELVVATMAVIFNARDGADLDSEQEIMQLQEKLRRATREGTDQPLFTLPVALSILVFFALCAQCAATLAIIRRETNSWRWPIFTFTYMTTLAYLGAFITFQVATFLSG